MNLAPNWIVCESTGRWAAALRVALMRQTDAARMPRIQEIRHLAELHTNSRDSDFAISIIEVRSENFAVVLNILSEGWRRDARIVALLDTNFSSQPAIDALLEAGALAVIDSPRRMASVLKLGERVAASYSVRKQECDSSESIADRAWAALPWQDA